jgi:hypothetical protein
MKSLTRNNSKYFEMCSRKHLKHIIKITKIYNSKFFSAHLQKKKKEVTWWRKYMGYSTDSRVTD